MIEVFSGTATLCSVAKQFGLDGSLALDKMRKKGAKATIFVFDILDPKDQELLYHWLESDLVAWVHIAPVCGTCSRARQIRNGGPRPLRSDTYPMGLPDLTSEERQRVDLANKMYVESCKQAVSTLRFKTNLGDHGEPVIKYFLVDGSIFAVATGHGGFPLRLSNVYDGWIKTKVDKTGCKFCFNFRTGYCMRSATCTPTLG